MNIYLITSDGEAKCYAANSMQEACAIAEDQYIEEMRQYHWERGSEFVEVEERELFRWTILDSCNLVGELANMELPK